MRETSTTLKTEKDLRRLIALAYASVKTKQPMSQLPSSKQNETSFDPFDLVFGDERAEFDYSKDVNDHLPAGIQREMFMPYRYKDLARLLVKHYDLDSQQSSCFHQFCENLTTRFHVEHLCKLLGAEDAYEPFDPDSHAIELNLHLEGQSTDDPEVFFQHLREMLNAAHYVRLDKDVLQTAIDLGNDWGINLSVNWDSIEYLDVYVRGYRTTTKTRRRWQNLFMLEEIEFPIFKRMVIAFKLKHVIPSDKNLDPDCIYLKSFKDIPETDLELLLPGAHVKLTLIDRGMIILPSLPGMAVTVYKVIRGALLFTVAASIAKLLGWGMLIAAIGGYITKSVMSYIRTKQKYRFGLTKNLMTKNLDNNTGVLYRLFNEAEEQELCETILAYYFLWRLRLNDAISSDELDRRVELFLLRTTGYDIDFDVDDALAKLAKFGLARQNGKGEWFVVPIERAPARLRESIEQILPEVAADQANEIANGCDSAVLPLRQLDQRD